MSRSLLTTCAHGTQAPEADARGSAPGTSAPVRESSPRILHVVPSMASRYGGPAFATTGHALVAQTFGYSVAVMTTNLGSPPAWLRGAGSIDEFPPRVAEIDVRVFACSRLSRFAHSPSLAGALRESVSGSRLVRIHSLWLYPQFTAWRAAIASGTPYVVSFHGALDPYLRRRGRLRKYAVSKLWQDRMLEEASAIHVTTDVEAELTSDIAPSTPRLIAPNGIWVDEFTRLPDKAMSKKAILGNEKAGRLVVSSIGRLARKKALDRLLMAFALLPPALRTTTQVVLAGPDDEGQGSELRRLAISLGIAEHVTFMGMLGAEQRQTLLAATDIWVLPSHTENFGIAVLEAMAAARPVIVSPGVMIAPELEREGAAIVAANEPASFAAALSELIADEPARRDLSQNAARLARRYDWLTIGPVIERAILGSEVGAT